MPARLSLVLFCTGLLGIGYEVLVVRVLSQVLENTIYSFAGVLSVYLFGTACRRGALPEICPPGSLPAGSGFIAHRPFHRLFCGDCPIVVGPFHLPGRAGESLGDGMWGSVLGEVALALVVFFLPTVCMGATFSHLAQGARRPEEGLGRALGVNTLGSALAPAFFGVLCLPALGAKTTLTLLALGYLCLALLWRPARRWSALLPLGLALFLFFTPDHLRMVDLPAGGKIVAHAEGVMATVTVVQDAGHDRYLKVNNHFVMGGTASFFSDARQALIPLLLHPRPQQALFLGLGTGATFGAAALYPGLQADGVELVPEIVPLLAPFPSAHRRSPGSEAPQGLRGRCPPLRQLYGHKPMT